MVKPGPNKAQFFGHPIKTDEDPITKLGPKGTVPKG